MKKGWNGDWQTAATRVSAAQRMAFRVRWELGKLLLVAVSLFVGFVVLPCFYWPGFPVFAQVIGCIAVVGGTGLLALVMAADAASKG